MPGYAIIGTVDATGKNVHEFRYRDRVAALTAYGGYSEYIFLKQKRLIHIQSFREDWVTLFRLSEVGKIKPMIQKVSDLRGGSSKCTVGKREVIGNVVLVAPELVWKYLKEQRASRTFVRLLLGVYIS